MSGFRGLDVAPAGSGAVFDYLRKIRDVVNNMLIGKLNATVDVTLAANEDSTTVQDPRIGGDSALLLGCPMTANAAAELGSGTLYVASVGNQTATLIHANNGQTDRTFRIVIVG